MNERLALRFALVASGLALIVALFGLWQTKQSLVAITDHELKLESDNAALQKRVNDEEKNVMLALANRFESLYSDLGMKVPGADDKGPLADAKPYEDSLISKIPIPEKKPGVTHVAVPADVAATVLGTPLNLAAEVSLSPSVKNRKPDGFALFEVRSGGLAPALGFEQGDVVHAVNGKPFRTTEEIAAAWDELKDAKKFTFDLDRGGKPMKLVVDIAKP